MPKISMQTVKAQLSKVNFANAIIGGLVGAFVMGMIGEKVKQVGRELSPFSPDKPKEGNAGLSAPCCRLRVGR